MIETLYSQLISDPNTRKVLCRTDKRNVTTETIYRDDCKIIIRHKLDDFLSCLIVKRQQAITKTDCKNQLDYYTYWCVTTLLQITIEKEKKL